MKLTEFESWAVLYKTAIKAQVKSGAGVRFDRWRTDRSVTLTYVPWTTKPVWSLKLRSVK